jgi:hypothetical protein
LYLHTQINLDISSCMLGAAILYSCAALNNIGGKSCSDSPLLGNDIKVYIYMLSVLPTGVFQKFQAHVKALACIELRLYGY